MVGNITSFILVKHEIFNVSFTNINIKLSKLLGKINKPTIKNPYQ